MVTLIDKGGILVATDDNPDAIAIDGAFLRKADLFRRFYVFEVTAQVKYPVVSGLSGSSEDLTYEVFIDGNDRTMYYSSGVDAAQQLPDGIPGMAVLSVTLPKKSHLWHKMLRRERWNRPQWHVAVNEFHDKWGFEVLCWYA